MSCPETTAATAAFRDALRVRLIAEGVDIRDVVFEGARAPVPEDTGPDVLFTQICGYPLCKIFRDQGTVLATPSFAFAGCEGANHCAFFTVRAKDPAERLGGPTRARVRSQQQIVQFGYESATADACADRERQALFPESGDNGRTTSPASIISIGKRSTSAPLTA